MRKVIIYPGEDGYWVAECPSLPGCVSQGVSRTEALSNMREAIDLYTDVLLEKGKPVPEDLLEVVAL
ncbi:MAG: type II toxin-antitoxin system HicB family antitoxin [Candidatus Hydrogenedentes bacterium]|nr:type II toxin-antitoxin system HicB family antitoxin [Candidatus Hydrogenedentota bacterium]